MTPNVMDINPNRVTVTETKVEKVDAKSIENFDFTIDPVAMDRVTNAIYHKVYRKAALAHEKAVLSGEKPDMSIFPAGKVMTRAEIESLLGGTIEESLVPQECC